MRIAAHPGLYQPDVDPPRLRGSRCAACGRAFVPPLALGCEVCGAPEASLEPIELAAGGTLYSVATVHLHAGKDIDAPFTMAEIVLDDGPLIRATMADLTEPDAIGARVTARFIVTRVDDAGDEIVEPRFSVVGS